MSRPALGIDVGLTGARAALVDADGRVLARSQMHPIPSNASGAEDPRSWYDALRQAAGDVVRDASESRPGSISVAGAGCRPVIVDEGLEPLLPARLAAHDTRARSQRVELARALGVPAEALADHAAPILLRWREHEPAAFRRAVVALDTTSFLVSRLTGEPAIDRITAADYLLPGIEALVPIPEPREPDAVAGPLTSPAAADLGLDPGIPVTVGTYDSYVDIDALGGQAHEGSLLLGTTMVVATGSRLEPGIVGDLRVVEAVGRRRLLAGWTSAAGGSIDWSRARFGAGDVAALAPGAGGLVALPYLAGERTPVWDVDARGAILGLTGATTALELERAVLDGVALSGRDIVERMRDAGHDPGRWRAGGGGVHHPAWLQAASDAMRAPIDAVDITGGVAAAVFGLRALGADPAVPVIRSVKPDPARADRFDRLYQLYGGLYRELARTMHELGELDRDHQ
jgi:xylulokinase